MLLSHGVLCEMLHEEIESIFLELTNRYIDMQIVIDGKLTVFFLFTGVAIFDSVFFFGKPSALIVYFLLMEFQKLR